MFRNGSNNPKAKIIESSPSSAKPRKNMDKVRVIVIEDHDLTRMGLVAALQHREGIQVVGEAISGLQGLKLLEEAKPHVAIIDIDLPMIHGIELVRRFQQNRGEDSLATKILMLTMYNTQEQVLAAFSAGADSYCMKDTSVDKLVEAIYSTHKGNPWIDPVIAGVIRQQVRQNFAFGGAAGSQTVVIHGIDPEHRQLLENAPLTERELEILALIVGGFSNAQIAGRLYITIGTVKTHVRNILNKLSVDDRTQAAVLALRSGLVA
jgi:DNA-binding NarL/FixJ family response regulator